MIWHSIFRVVTGAFCWWYQNGWGLWVCLIRADFTSLAHSSIYYLGLLSSALWRFGWPCDLFRCPFSGIDSILFSNFYLSERLGLKDSYFLFHGRCLHNTRLLTPPLLLQILLIICFRYIVMIRNHNNVLRSHRASLRLPNHALRIIGTRLRTNNKMNQTSSSPSVISFTIFSTFIVLSSGFFNPRINTPKFL